ncbi:MAG: hypothetical protein KDB07_06150, partial [Planctomycetes bacterium]|nr:hypothetical protein [Planctomycetota bacterium]
MTLFGAGSCCSIPEPAPSKAEKEPWELLPLDSTDVEVEKLMGEPYGGLTLRVMYPTGYKGLDDYDLSILRGNTVTRTWKYKSGIVVHFNMLGKVHSIEQADPDDIDSWEGKTLRMFAGVRE